MSYMRGDDVMPAGAPPRSCIVCGLYERGRGWRMGFARAAHGRKHVREGNAREVIRYETYDYVLTDAGVKIANALFEKDRCKSCGLAEPQHARHCMVGYMQKRMKEKNSR